MDRKMIRIAAGIALLLQLTTVACGQTKLETGWIASETPWKTPFYVHDSAIPGPTLVVVGGIHGNEPAGYRAAEQIRYWPIVRGRIVVIPKANVLGLRQHTRFVPKSREPKHDLNRDFPGADRKEPQTELAKSIWHFVIQQRPDWVVDLHEGFEFYGSHVPRKGAKKSVGSSVIYQSCPDLDPLAKHILAAVNRSVTRPDRRFALLDRGPVATSLANAISLQLGIPSMIFETTFKDQPRSLRARQHRIMVNQVMRDLRMLDHDCVDVLCPADKQQVAFVALYDGPGTSVPGVFNMTTILDQAHAMAVCHVGPLDMRSAVLSQFDAVVFPGGSGSKQANAIGDSGRDAVRKFIKEGGGYLGVCAGAYLCSAHYSWSLGLIDTKVLTGTVEIPGVGKKSMWFRGPKTAVSIELTTQGQEVFPGVSKQTKIVYQNGPIISAKHTAGLPPYKVLANFRTENALYPCQEGTMRDTPAIVCGAYGSGRVISMSPHPEATKGLDAMIVAAISWVLGQEREVRHE